MTPREQQAEKLLKGRQQAYRAVFSPTNVFTENVLADLATFCRANQSTFHPDPRVAAELDGRREVWLRIQQHLQLTTDDLWRLFGAPTSKG